LQGDIQCAPLWCGHAPLRAVRTLRDQLSKSGEGQPSVELCRRYGQNSSSAALSQLAGDLQQAALAHAGLTDPDRASTVGQHPADDLQGVLAAVQAERCRRRPVHAGIFLLEASAERGLPAGFVGFQLPVIEGSL
jgi:hypothetical protein